MENKFGLKRSIPESVKREVRKKSEFGCVICGSIPYEYEHVIPEFHEAEKHDPNCITLLCGNCHGKVTRKIISKETVIKKMEIPYNLHADKVKGYEIEILPEIGPFKVKLGNIIGENVKNFLCVDGEPLLSLRKSEGNELCILNADFKNKQGESILKIIDNEWIASKESWDIECIGTKIIIREKKGEYNLILNKKNINFIEIERINMQHRGVQIFFDGKNGGEFTYNNRKIVLTGMVYKNSDHALRFQNNEIILHSNGDVYFKSLMFYRN